MSPDAGPLEQVYSVCPDVSDAGDAFELDGGTWVLPPPRGPNMYCKLVGCQEYVRQLGEPVPALSSTALTLMLVFSVGSLVLGFVGGWWLDRQLR